MLQGEQSAVPSTFIKRPFVIKIFVLFNFEWPFYTGLMYLLYASQWATAWDVLAKFYVYRKIYIFI